MDNQKYLIIITLIDGQNFSVPDGVPDRVEATVFAEARFGNESILKSDPIKLTNSNPEFVTELAWQLDKRSLHQIRVERRAIKLQVFLQTRDKRRQNRPVEATPTTTTNGMQSSASHKVELIGYTILDIRAAQERVQPKFQWLPLLNPKFRKSSYNRPEIQLAVTLSRVDEKPTPTKVDRPATTTKVKHDAKEETGVGRDSLSTTNESCNDTLDDSRFYKTCLDISADSESLEPHEIIENDIRIISKDGNFYIYDTRDIAKPTINDCDEKYKITITIPFNSDLDSLSEGEKRKNYYFSVNLFGSSLKSHPFHDLTSVETKELQFTILTTHTSVLATYFELNSSLVIRLHDDSGEPLGIATIQLDQLASLDTKKRSIEGIFALQPISDHHDTPSPIHPSIGVSIVLEKVPGDSSQRNQTDKLVIKEHIDLAKEHFGDHFDDYFFKSCNDTHQLTFGDSNVETKSMHSKCDSLVDCPADETDHHFCFTIDLKNFFYTQNQRLIPTLRELVVRYTYPFFGYKDTITTDTSIPISPTNSIIVSGYCEFNFATSADALITALSEMSLDLEILASDQIKRTRGEADDFEHIVATCSLNLAHLLNLNKFNVNQSLSKEIQSTVTPPIYGLDGQEVGKLQIYLSLKDLGKPIYNFKASIENLECGNEDKRPTIAMNGLARLEQQELNDIIVQAKTNFKSLKEDFLEQLTQEMKKRETERFRRLCQRFETKEAKRELEFMKKIQDLSDLERRFKDSLDHIESLEKRLANNFDQLKTKDALLDNRLDTFDLKISKAIGDIKLEYEKRSQFLTSNIIRNPPAEDSDESPRSRVFTKTINNINQPRRSSLKGPSTGAGIPISVRSSSLARAPSDSTQTRLVKRPTGIVTTVVNGLSSRPRSNSTRLNLSKETQEKLASLRREKAELLKRGCRPNDELIQEINSLIEKLAC